MSENQHKKKALERFLSGEESEVGERLFHSWYDSFDDGEDILSSDASENRSTKNLQPGRTHFLANTPWWRVAATVVFFILSGICVINIAHQENGPVVLLEQEISPGKKGTMHLADGSVVVLNAGSKIRYPEKFTSEKREIFLEGEAFFDVAKDESRPFVIHSGEVTVTVLGTTFNVKSFANADLHEVVVVTGKVSVGKSNSDMIPEILRPNEKIQLNRETGVFQKSKVHAPDYVSWKQGLLFFDDVFLNDVVKEVMRRYDVKVSLESESLKECRLTATFDVMPVEDIINLLCQTVDASWKKSGSQYSIYGKGCKKEM